MQQLKFDNTYRALLRRWTQLGKQDSRTWLEQQEYEAADRYLSVRELTSDYDQLMQIGDLGGTEL